MEKWTVLTPVPLICNEILKGIKELYPDVSFIFDPSLTYEESIHGIRALRSAFDITQIQTFPLFTFSMGAVKPSEIPRKQFPHARTAELGIGKNYKSRHCIFEIPWKWYYSDIIASKTFEVMFATETSINLVKDIQIEFTDIGIFDFQVIWDFQSLDSVSYNRKDNLYMSCDGTCQVMGEFVMLSDVPLKYILEIDARIKDYFTHTLLSGVKITPEGYEHYK